MSEVLLVGINSKYVHTNLAIRYIKKYLNKKDINNIEIYESTINNHLSDIIKDIFIKKPKLVCFSVYIWNKEFTFKIMKELKKILPNIKILLGGPEISFDSEEVLKKYKEVDYIIKGEGEKIFYNFLSKNIKEVNGVYYRENDQIKFNGEEKEFVNMDELPFPYTKEEFEGFKSKIYYYESSRGCPFSCSYCMSSIDKRVRFASIEKVKDDLMVFIKNEVDLVKFVDRTFNLKKERYLNIWKFLVENYNNVTTFHFEISADLFDDEVINFLKTVPEEYFQFEVGVQTSDSKTIELIKRKTDLKKLKENIMKMDKNIHLHLDLIAGLPEETYVTFKKSFDFVYSMKPEMIQLGFLKILKGTLISGQIEEYQYKFLNFPPYEVLENRVLSYEEMIKLKNIEEVLDVYYNSEKFSKSLNFVIDNFYKSSFELFEEIATYWNEKGYFEISHKVLSTFNHFYDFYKYKKFDDINIFLEYLKLDYLLCGKPGNYPYWYDRKDNKNLYNNILTDLEFKSKREAYKKTEFEVFNYDIINHKSGEKKILFIYDKKTKIKVC